MRLRFSLGGLLLATTFIGVACYWRSRPLDVAEEFTSAVAAKNFAAADAMFHRKEDALLVEFLARNYRNKVQAARVADQTIGDWFRGECTVELALSDADGVGALLMLTIPVDSTGLGAYRYTGGKTGITGFFDPQSAYR